MSSEIRANTLKNRVGLSTINITNTGIVVSGVATATTFSGNLTGNLSGGTVSGTTGTFSGNLSVAQNIVHTGDTDTKIEFLTNNICFDTNNVERVRISSNGRVGIGTDNPSSYALHLLGSSSALARFEREGGEAWAKVDIKAGTSSGNSYLTFSDPDNSEVAAINYEHGNDTFRIESWNGSSKVLRIGITTTGNIGINDASPERTLDVVGNNAMIQIEGSGGSGKQWSLCSADNTTGAAVGTAGMFAIYNDTDGVAALRISNSNYVLRPKLPYFNCTATPTVGSPAIHSFGNVRSNNGSHYDNSNGRFTAPVTGFYWFSCGIFCNATASNGTLIQLMRYIQSSNSEQAFAGANHSDQYNNLNCSAGTYLESGDYVYIHQTNVSIQGSTPRNYFSGYLVG